MKQFFKVFFTIVLALVICNTKAQIVKAIVPTKTTLANTDTAYAVLPVDGSFKSARAYVTKTSGTVAGKVYLIADFGDGYFERLDSLTLSNQTLNYKTFSISSAAQNHAVYKLQFITSGGSQASIPTVKYLRRG